MLFLNNKKNLTIKQTKITEALNNVFTTLTRAMSQVQSQSRMNLKKTLRNINAFSPKAASEKIYNNLVLIHVKFADIRLA